MVKNSGENKIFSLKDKLEAAKSYHRSGNLVKAEELYREILEQDPSNAEATHLLGLLAMQVGKFELAKFLIESAIKLDSKDPVFYVNLGVVYYLLKDFEKAKQLFKKAIDMDPAYIEAYGNLGKLLAEEDFLEEARKFLVKAVNLGDRDPSVLITLAEVNYRLGAYSRSEELCNIMIHELDMEEKQVLEILVKSLLKQNKALEAAPYVEILIQRWGETPMYKKFKDKIYEYSGIANTSEVGDIKQ